MRGLILCEGKADRILVSYYLCNVLGFRFSNQDLFVTPSYVLEQKVSGSIFSKDNHDSYVNKAGDCLMIAEVHGFDFVPAIMEFLEWNSEHRYYDCFDKVVVITDNDDADASERLGGIIKNLQVQDVVYQANQWYVFNYKDGFGEENTYSFLFLLQPMTGYGNLETFVMDALAGVSELDKDIVTKARQYIASIDKKNGKYLTVRGDRSKAELSAYFSVVAPRRTFDPINSLLNEIQWQDYEKYNNQFVLLRQLI